MSDRPDLSRAVSRQSLGGTQWFFVGLDWASQAHAVCVLDHAGRLHWRGSVPHSAEGLTELRPAACARFRARRRRCHVALERPSGLLVDTLVEPSFTVVPIHPNARQGQPPPLLRRGGKSDAGDAFSSPTCCAPMAIASGR